MDTSVTQIKNKKLTDNFHSVFEFDFEQAKILTVYSKHINYFFALLHFFFFQGCTEGRGGGGGYKL